MDYNEQLTSILSNEELDNDGKVSEIAKLTGANFVSQSNYKKVQESLNQANETVKTYETELTNVKGELENLKTSQMSEDEKLTAAIAKADEREKAANIVINKYAVREILAKEISNADELTSLVDQITTDDIEKSKSIAENLANTFKKQKEAIEAKTREELIKETPKPNGGEEGSKAMTKEEFMKLSYEEQVKFKTENPEGYKKIFN